MGVVKVWVAEPQEQATVRAREVLISVVNDFESVL